jgi:hypothetical protein
MLIYTLSLITICVKSLGYNLPKLQLMHFSTLFWKTSIIQVPKCVLNYKREIET